MLDLESWVGLDEGERLVVAFCFVIDQEFESAEIAVVRGGRQLLSSIDDARTQSLAQRGTRRHLDQFLVAALDRAFALPEMADRAMVVADDLHFDVAGVANQTLDIDAVAAEGGLGLGLAARIGLVQFRSVVDDAHAATAATGDGLDHHGGALAHRRKEGLDVVEAGRSLGALDDGHAALLRQRLGLPLVAEQIECLGRRADEDNVFFGTAPRQCGVLAEETVAGMQRIASGRLRR